MSDEKKYTLDDILAEYDRKKSMQSGNISHGLTEDAETEDAVTENAVTENAVTENAVTEDAVTESVETEDAATEAMATENVETEAASEESAETENAETERAETDNAEIEADAETAASLTGTEKTEISGQEEYDNYEDGEEQDFSGKGFAEDPMFAPAELFDSDNFRDGQDSTEEENEDFETSEEIFVDEDEDDLEKIEIEDELLEEEQPESSEDETESSIEVVTEEADDARTWAENGITDEITDIDIPDETEDNKDGEEEESVPGEPEESSEKDAVSDASEEAEDVNDKWIVRFAKGIFPVKGDSVGEVIRKIIFLAALIVFIGAGVMLVSTLIQSRQALDEKDKAKDIITTTLGSYIGEDGNVVIVSPTEEEEAQHNFDVAAYYKKINPDYVGYLEVEGCDIYEPVVQGEDNDYYLKTNISGGYNKAGTVFMDFRCVFDKDYASPNIVLYGHNQEDGTMFGNLKWYKHDVDFYSEHPTVKFSSEFKTEEYIIYGFFVTNANPKQSSIGEVFHYHDYIETMNDEYTFNWYIKQVQRRNQIVSPVDVKFGDKLLCLSTCSNEFTDSRFVVFARKLRDGESASDYDFSKTYLNPNAETVDWDAIMSGESTPSPEVTDVIEEEEDDAPEVAAINKSNGKTNSGRGSKNNEVTLVPPPPAETTVTETTTVPETTKKKKTTTTASETTVSETTKKKKTTTEASEVTESQEEISESEISQEESTVTEAPSDEESEQTETAA